MFDIFLHHKRYKVVKHTHTQITIPHDWFNLSSWNRYTSVGCCVLGEAKYYKYIISCYNSFMYFLCRFVCKNNGVLFENDLIQIGVKCEFRQNLGRLGLFYGNKTSFPLQVIFIKLDHFTWIWNCYKYNISFITVFIVLFSDIYLPLEYYRGAHT